MLYCISGDSYKNNVIENKNRIRYRRTKNGCSRESDISPYRR